MLETLWHLVGSEAFYYGKLTGEAPAWWDREDETVPPLAEIRTRSEEMARRWEALLATGPDPDRGIVDPRRDGTVDEVPAGVLFTQTLNHGNVHREQACAIVSSRGLEAPDVDGWAYGEATGRIRKIG